MNAKLCWKYFIFSFLFVVFCLIFFKPEQFRNIFRYQKTFQSISGYDDERLRLVFNKDLDNNWTINLHNYLLEKGKHWNQGKALCPVSSDKHVVLITDREHRCNSYPILISDNNDALSDIDSHLSIASKSTPCFLTLVKSKIPNANLGIFTGTNIRIPMGYIFGPYVGIIRSAFGDDGLIGRRSGYSWRVNDIFIDGMYENRSNWMRYVNTARFLEEQNLFSVRFNESVYYITFKTIEPNSELLVWYGFNYAKYLNISVISESRHDWTTDYAPPLNETICPSCPKLNAI